ncbi:MAG TPA: hypothetical protein VHT26_04360 [Trebonia sp.]|nr:hypothetical protein [Trebonia sp.]
MNFWCRPNGKWQKLLPGVYLTVTGKPTSEQRLVAAMLYAGSRGAITGPAALRLHRLRCPGPDVIDVLVPWAVKRQSISFVRTHRTTRMPNTYRTGVVRFAGPARAVADAARLFTSLDDVKAVVAEAIQKRACSIVEIGLELQKGASQDSARLREALASARTGVRSVAEDRFRERVERSNLPAPRYNVFLRATDGTDIGEVDAWWADAGVSVEIDSQEYHFYRADWLRTDAKRSRLLKHGIFPHNIAPARVANDWDAVYEELSSSLEIGRKRPRLPIVAFDPAA